MSELNRLYKCQHCGGYTPRRLMYCHWCGARLPDNEVAKNAEDNRTEEFKNAKQLPKNYKKFGEE